MNIGSYLIDAGTIISMLFKSQQMQQVGTFLITLGTALVGGAGTVGPIRLANVDLNITITKVS